MSGPRPSAHVIRRRRLVVAALVLLVLATGAWMVTRSPLLDVDHVEVRGNAEVSVEQVVAASGVHTGDPLVWLDGGGAARRVEALPWVRTATVQREWPHTVRITVTEREPVAWVDRGGGQSLVVDRTGRVLADDAAPPAGLPQLLDVKQPAPVGAAVTPADGARLAGRLGPYVRAIVRSVSLAADGSATLVVTSGQEVRLGRPVELGDKLRAAVAVLAQPEAAGKTYVDVSAASTPVAG